MKRTMKLQFLKLGTSLLICFKQEHFEISIFDLVKFWILLHNVSIFVVSLGQQKCKQIFAPPIEHFFIVTKFHQIMTWEKDVWIPSLVLGQMF